MMNPIDWNDDGTFAFDEPAKASARARYFWLFLCERRCSYWLETRDRYGDRAWMRARCRYDGSALRPVSAALSPS